MRRGLHLLLVLWSAAPAATAAAAAAAACPCADVSLCAPLEKVTLLWAAAPTWAVQTLAVVMGADGTASATIPPGAARAAPAPARS